MTKTIMGITPSTALLPLFSSGKLTLHSLVSQYVTLQATALLLASWYLHDSGLTSWSGRRALLHPLEYSILPLGFFMIWAKQYGDSSGQVFVLLHDGTLIGGLLSSLQVKHLLSSKQFTKRCVSIALFKAKISVHKPIMALISIKCCNVDLLTFY